MNVHTKRLGVILTAGILVMLLLVSCTGAPAPRGWAGVNEINGTLVFISMSGRIYSVDGASGAVRGEPVKLVTTSTGGFLSCGTSTGAVPVYSAAAVSGDLALVGGYDGKVYAFPVVEGRLREQPRWIYPPQGNIGSPIVGGLVVAGNKVFFGSTTGTVFALNAADGFKEWSINLGQKIWASPAVDGNLIYISTIDKELIALSTADGTEKWRFETGGAISATPVVGNGLVYIGSYDRHMYALDAGTGNVAWKFPADGVAGAPQNWFWAKPILAGSVVFAPSLDGKVYALDARSGNLVRVIDVGDPVSASPVVVGQSVVVAATNLAKKTSRVLAISTVDYGVRELTNFSEGVNAPLFAINEMVYLHTAKDNFYGLNTQNGALQKYSLTTTTK